LKKRIIVYAGQYYDAETGLHYNYHRYYDPSLGRYLRADPIGLAGGINPYAYVQVNPLNRIDPLGLSWASAVIGPIAITVIVADDASGIGAFDDWMIPVLVGWMVSNSAGNPTVGDYSPWSPDPSINRDFIRDRDRVKDLDGPPPPYKNPKKPTCEELRDRIKHLEKAMGARENLTNRWYGEKWNAGHAFRQSRLKKQRDRIQRRLDRGDCVCP
jgi:RHS repeat-associated protein